MGPFGTIGAIKNIYPLKCDRQSDRQTDQDHERLSPLKRDVNTDGRTE